MSDDLADLMNRATRGLALDDGNAPEAVIRSYRQHRCQRRIAGGAAAGVAVLVAAVTVPLLGGSSSSGMQRIVPAAMPSASSTSRRVAGVTRAIVLVGGSLRLDPAGPPSASTASSERLLAADQGAVIGGPNARTQLLYGAFTHDTADLQPDLIPGQHLPVAYNHRLAVWIVDHDIETTSGKPVPLTFYTAVDPVTAKVLFAWNVQGATSTKPLTHPYYGPPASTLPTPTQPRTGILNDVPGQFHGTFWSSTNVWVREVSPGSYLFVWAGGEPVDPTLQRTEATAAGVLVQTPKDRLTGEDSTRYVAPGAPIGKLQLLSVHGSILTLQLVGTGTTYTFNTTTDAWG